MKLAIITSTRPELIRLSKIINKARKYYDVTHIYTNQNFDASLSTQFFDEFNIHPDYTLLYEYPEEVYGTYFIGECISTLVRYINRNNLKFDAVLILGDTNGAFASACVAKRFGIPIFHMEAGNRCYDNERVPEEINRRQIDAIADWHLCYTQRAREQLLLEGHHPSKCIVVGNPIYEIIPKRKKASLFKKYLLVTLHRKENLNGARYLEILLNMEKLNYPIKLSAHPSLMSRVGEMKFRNIKFFTPTNFDDFIQLEYNAYCVITDSGTVPEECSYLNIPCVLLRHSTERPELLENNSMVMCSDPKNLAKNITIAISENTNDSIKLPDKVSSKIIKILTRYNQ